MKKRILKAIGVLALVLCVLPGCGVNAQENEGWEKNSQTGKYEFPVTVYDNEWKNFETLVQKQEACDIPNEILNELSTEELVDLVLEYPLLVNIFAFSDVDEGIEKVSETFSGLKELMSREDAGNVLIKAFLNSNNKIKLRSNTDDNNRDYIKNEYLKVLLTRNQVKDNMSKVTRVQYNVLNTFGLISTRSTTTYVLTPKNSQVPVIEYSASEDMTASAKTQMDADFKLAYPNAVLKSGSTRIYNCHNYAWNKDNPTKYCMNNPNPYMTDGSYVYVGGYPTANGQIVYYPYTEKHSGIVTDYVNLKVKSKWGLGPLMEHNVYDCPYFSTPYAPDSLKYYRLNN